MARSWIVVAAVLCLAFSLTAAYDAGEYRCQTDADCPRPPCNPDSCVVPTAGTCVIAEGDTSGDCSASSFKLAGPHKGCKDANGEQSCCGAQTGECLSASDVDAPCTSGPCNHFCSNQEAGASCGNGAGVCQPDPATPGAECPGPFCYCSAGTGSSGRKLI